MQPDTVLIPVPWFRESAFRAWVKKSCVGFGGAFVGAASGSLPDGVTLLGALGIAGLYSVGDFILSVPDIFFSGPDTYQAAPPTPPTP